MTKNDEKDLELFNKLKENIDFNNSDFQKRYKEYPSGHCFARNLPDNNKVREWLADPTAYDYYLGEILNRHDEHIEKKHYKHKNISKTTSINDYDYLVGVFLKSNQSENLSKKLISGFFEKVYNIVPEDYGVISVVSGISFEANSMKLGPFSITKKTLREIEKDYSSFAKEFPDSIGEGPFYLIECKISTRGLAHDLDKMYVRSHTSKNFNKYFDDFVNLCHYFRGCRCCINISKSFASLAMDADLVGTNYIYPLLNTKPIKFKWMQSLRKYREIAKLDGEGNIFDGTYNDKALFDLVDKDRKELESNIYNAIMWAGKSLMDRDLERAFVQLFIGLESLSYKPINDFVALLLGDSPEERKDIAEKVGNFHDIRSNIVHQNSKNIQVSNAVYYELLEIVKRLVDFMRKDSELNAFIHKDRRDCRGNKITIEKYLKNRVEEKKYS